MPPWSVEDYIGNCLMWILGKIIDTIRISVGNYLRISAILICLFIACIAIGCKPSVAWDFTVAMWGIIKLSMITRFTLVRDTIIGYLVDHIHNIL